MKMKAIWWNKDEAVIAERVVLSLAMKIIDEKIPGDTCIFSCGPGNTISIPKARIVSVFKWIVKQTRKFQIPIDVNFSHSPASDIGYCLSTIFHPRLSNELYALEQAGIHVPRFSDYSGGIMFSDLSRSRGNLGESHDGVTTIVICSQNPNPSRVVMLDSIPSV